MSTFRLIIAYKFWNLLCNLTLPPLVVSFLLKNTLSLLIKICHEIMYTGFVKDNFERKKTLVHYK